MFGGRLAAFRHFITHHNDGRPFILAGHSQGSGHLQRLIDEELDTNWDTLGGRFIAAYIIGGGYPEAKVLATQNLRLCQSPIESGVIIGWDVNSKDAGPSFFADPTKPLIKTVPALGNTQSHF